MDERKSKEALSIYAAARGIPRQELMGVLRRRGVVGGFDPEYWGWYLSIINDEVLARRKAERLDRENTPSAIARRCTDALRRWGERKWLFPPVKRVGDEFVYDPYDVVDGELVYAGVLNE